MKKRSFLVGVVCFILIFAMTGCNISVSKTALTSDGFRSIVEEQGFTVTDAADQSATEITEALTASSPDGWEVQFFVFVDVANAAWDYNTFEAEFVSLKGGVSMESRTNMENYASYDLTSNGLYMRICRVDNTMLYVKVPAAYKDDARELIKALGY